MAKVSVIVPIYNVEAFIERCVRSLFEQTLDDMEFIFIDDCTPDNSMFILRNVLYKYPDRVPQTRIISMPTNSGLPVARKQGICLATGDYIIHCDSDDWVDVNMYQTLYERAIEDDSDAVFCGYYCTDGINYNKHIDLFSYDTNISLINSILKGVSPSLCTKLFKRSLYSNDISYPQSNMGEDAALCIQLIYYCKRVSCLPAALYYYYHNLNSISNSSTPEKIMNRFNQVCDNLSLIEHFIGDRLFQNRSFLKALRYYKHKQRDILTPLLIQSNYYKIWLRHFKNLNIYVFFLDIPLKSKILFALRLLRLYMK